MVIHKLKIVFPRNRLDKLGESMYNSELLKQVDQFIHELELTPVGVQVPEVIYERLAHLWNEVAQLKKELLSEEKYTLCTAYRCPQCNKITPIMYHCEVFNGGYNETNLAQCMHCNHIWSAGYISIWLPKKKAENVDYWKGQPNFSKGF